MGLMAYIDGLESRGKILKKHIVLKKFLFNDDDFIIDCSKQW